VVPTAGGADAGPISSVAPIESADLRSTPAPTLRGSTSRTDQTVTIQVKPNYPAHPRALHELANDLEQATGEEVEVWEVRGLSPVEIIDLVLDDVLQVATVALVFAGWRRRRRREDKEAPPITGVIYGPNDEVLREVPEDDD
jgi:hypothetical protein